MNSTHPWSNIPFSVIDCPKHKELALKMAHESLVLLQNNNNILPLNRQMKVAVIGPNANDSVMQWGNYNGFPSHTVTLLEGIRAKLPDAQIIYEPVCGYTNDTTLHSLFNQCSIDGEAGFNATYWNNREYKGNRPSDHSFPFQCRRFYRICSRCRIEKLHRHLSFHFPPNRFRCRHFPRDD